MENHMNYNRYIGIDVSKKMLVCVGLKDNNTIERFQTKTEKKGLDKLMNWIKNDDLVALEAGNQAFALAKQIMEKTGSKAIVLNPGDLVMIYRSLKKTDNEDALKLARLIKRIPQEELPIVSLPSEKEIDARRLVSEQELIQTTKVRTINRLHALFVHAGMTYITKSDIKNRAKRYMYIDIMNKRFQCEAKRLNKQIELSEELLVEVKEEIKNVLKANAEKVRYPLSMPGIGPMNAITILSYLGNVDRFSSGKQVAYYAGLVPRVDISGDTARYGGIVKRGCKHIRRVIIQAAWTLVKSSHGGELAKKYHELKERRGTRKAIVAVARKMLETIYAMMRDETYYRGSTKDFIDYKLKLFGLQ
ncbi:IS110 family transposase [Spirochaetota bacterium]